jgi:hypothetical protein
MPKERIIMTDTVDALPVRDRLDFNDEALRERFVAAVEMAYERADPKFIVPWTEDHNDGELSGRDLAFNTASRRYEVDLQTVTCTGWAYPRISQVVTRLSDDAEMHLTAYGDGRMSFGSWGGEIADTPERAVSELEKFVAKIER